MTTFIWILWYVLMGIGFAVISVWIDYKRNGGDNDTLIAMITIFIWPLLLIGVILTCIAAVPVYFGKKLYYRKTERMESEG